MNLRKGGLYHFIGGSITFFLLLNLVILAIPTAVQEYTGINTTELQNSTNISASVDANQTSTENVVNQASSLVDIYTNFNSQNPVLIAIGTLFIILLIVALIDLIWL